MSVVSASVASPVSVTTAGLIALARQSRGISLQSGVISAVQSGDYQSAFKGRGMEYDESRLYQAGDDIRNIDWRVTARTGKAHTKLFCEERERPVYCWVDFRAPMFFATRGKYKAVRAAELASLFAWSACRQGDRIGAVVFTDTLQHELKPQRGKSAVLHLINTMVNLPIWQRQTYAQSSSAIIEPLLNLRRIVRPGSLVILLSDFRGLDNGTRSHLIRLRQHNDVIMVHIYDWLESQLPPAGRYRMSDGEHELEIDTGDTRLIASYQQKFAGHQQRLLSLATKHHINYLVCRTDNLPEQIIREGLKQR